MKCEDCNYSVLVDWRQDEKTGKSTPTYWCKKHKHYDDEMAICVFKNERSEQNVGTMSEKVTNGDMIKALYPNIEEERIDDIINIYSLCEHSVTFDTDWWDKPYRAESKCDNNHDCEHCDWTECPLEVETDGESK